MTQDAHSPCAAPNEPVSMSRRLIQPKNGFEINKSNLQAVERQLFGHVRLKKEQNQMVLTVEVFIGYPWKTSDRTSLFVA